MSRILVSDSISDDALSFLRQSGLEYDYIPDMSAQDLLRKIGSYDGLIVRSRTKVTKQVIERADRLKVVGRAGVGVDNIDVETAKQRNIKVVNTPDPLTNAVAEFTIGLMIDLARKIPHAAQSTRQGKWIKSAIQGEELKGKTYGTIGIGRIGARVSELSFAFGMKILANDVIPIHQSLIDKFHIKVATQDEVFEQSDFVDLHVPLTRETTNLVDYDKICKMKKEAYIINTSRGKVVNESDLIRALNEGKIAGAALDVFEVEPPNRTELLKNDKVILTPHIAGQTEEAQSEAGRLVVELVLHILKRLIQT